MSKYDEGFKLEVVQEYLSGSGGARLVATRFGLDHGTVRHWVESYRHHGKDGLRQKRPGRYSAAFKLSVLRRMDKDELSHRQAAALFDLRGGHGLVASWERRYHDGGPSALKPKTGARRGKNDYTQTSTAERLCPSRGYAHTASAARGKRVPARGGGVPKKIGCLDSLQSASCAEKAKAVIELRGKYALALLLRAVGLARSTFYYQAGVLQAGDRHAGLKSRIRAIYERHKGRYGYRRITAELCKDGSAANHKTVQRLMQEVGLKSLVRPKKYRAWGGQCLETPNLLQQQFKAAQPNQKWVTDVTEFNVRGDKLYLSPVMDLYNREIVAYEMRKRPLFALVANMLKKALARLGPQDAPMLHSDQGWQYQMHAWRRELAERGLRQSMSRRGNCLDNAAMESFFAVLKTEFFYLNKFASIEQLQHGLRRYIHYYNHHRIKLSLDGLSPVQYRAQALNP